MRHAARTVLLLLAPACAAGPGAGDPAPRPIGTGGVRDTAEAFAAAVNARDAERAADLVAWDLWVGEDDRLLHLVDELRKHHARVPPAPEDLASRPIPGASATLAELLDPDRARAALMRAARERFIAEFHRDFPPGDGASARVLAWHADQRERSATILMPDGEVLQARVVFQSGVNRLVPRF
jgi:hypothetical protein